MFNLDKTYYFASTNQVVPNNLYKYFPPDIELLSIPNTLNAGDRVGRIMAKLPPNPDANYSLIYINLINYLQYTNKTLCTAIASHRYLMDQKNHTSNEDTTQTEIDNLVIKNNLLVLEHQYSLRNFFAQLNTAVEQLLFLLQPFINARYDAISKFIKHINSNGGKKQKSYWNDSIKFLQALRLAFNYLKHHPYQFEAPHITIPTNIPSLLIVISKSNHNYGADKKIVEEYFENELSYFKNQDISFWLTCDFVIKEFNLFFEKFLKFIEGA